MGPERVWVQVIDVDMAADRAITFRSPEQSIGRRR